MAAFLWLFGAYSEAPIMLLIYRFILPLLVPYVIIAAYVLHFIDSKLLYCLFAFFWLAHNLFLGMFLVVEGTTLNYLLL